MTAPKVVVLREIILNRFGDEVSNDMLTFKTGADADVYLNRNEGYTQKRIRAAKGLPVIQDSNGKEYVVDKYGEKKLYTRRGFKSYLAKKDLKREKPSEQLKHTKAAERAKARAAAKKARLAAKERKRRRKMYKEALPMIQNLESEYGSISAKCVRENPMKMVRIRYLLNGSYKYSQWQW